MGRRVRDVMTHEVVTVDEHASFKEVATLLTERRVSALPVLDGEGRVVGIASEADLLLKEEFPQGPPDGRLFQSPRGGVVGASTYSRVWDEARTLALQPHQVDSPLAGRPYDLRHAGVSLWLNAGVPAPEVAERAGHSVDVLLKVYAKCIDGHEVSVNGRIQAALGDDGDAE